MSCDHKENLLLELALYRWSHCLLLAACRHDLPINGMLNVQGRAVGGMEVVGLFARMIHHQHAPSNVATLCGPNS